jgi:hypothetical protein
MNRERKQHEAAADGGLDRPRLLAVMLLFALFLGLAALALPALAGPSSFDRVDPLTGARLAEALRLKRMMGDSVWPGWGHADIPFIVSNGRYSFLIGRQGTPSGWVAVEGSLPDGQIYYRQQALTASDSAVRLDDGWAAVLHSSSAQLSIRDRLPSFIARLFPAPAPAVPAEIEIADALHRSFQAYQALAAPDHDAAARQALASGSSYSSASEAMGADWQREMSLLAQALLADSRDRSAALARQFLAARRARRAAAGLTAAQVEYERQMEWREGLPEYIELNMWRHAYIASDYQPLQSLADDPGFSGYQGFDDHWAGELADLEQPSRLDTTTRLAFSGMAQAILLDILGVDWKSRLLADDGTVALEDVLAQAVASPSALAGGPFS